MLRKPAWVYSPNVSGKWWTNDSKKIIRQMVTVNTRRHKRLTYFSLICLVIAWVTFFLWIRALNTWTAYSGQVSTDSGLNSFVVFMLATLAVLALCVVSVVVSSVCLKPMDKRWKILNIVIIVGSSLGILSIMFTSNSL